MCRVEHAQGVGMWIARSNDVTNACKQNARSIGKARADKLRRAKRARAGRGMVRASKEAHAHKKGVVDVGFWRRVWWCRLCVENAQCSEQRTCRGIVLRSPRVWPFSTGWQHACQVQLWFLVLTIPVVCVVAPSRRPCRLQDVRSSWVTTLLVCTRHHEFLANAQQCQVGVHPKWRL